jgi:hypothetical protein
MPSVMQTTRGISAFTASSIPAAARGGLVPSSASSTERLKSEILLLRDEDGSCSGASLLDGIRDVRKNGETEVLGSCLLWVRSAHNLGA